MQQVEIKIVGAEPSQAALASGLHSTSISVVRIYLADQEHVGTPFLNRFAHNFFGASVGVHLCRVDQVHAEIHA